MHLFRDLVTGAFSFVFWIIAAILQILVLLFIVTDANRRGKSGCLALLLGLLLPLPINLIVWLLVRPRERRLLEPPM